MGSIIGLTEALTVCGPPVEATAAYPPSKRKTVRTIVTINQPVFVIRTPLLEWPAGVRRECGWAGPALGVTKALYEAWLSVRLERTHDASLCHQWPAPRGRIDDGTPEDFWPATGLSRTRVLL